MVGSTLLSDSFGSWILLEFARGGHDMGVEISGDRIDLWRRVLVRGSLAESN